MPWFQRAFRPPQPDDPEASRVSELVHWILVVTEVGLVVMFLARISVGESLGSAAVQIGPVLVPMVILHAALHRGHYDLAAVGWVAVGWLGCLSAAFSSGGSSAPGLPGFVVIVVVAGVIWGGRAAIWVAALSCAALAGVLFLELHEMLPPPPFSPSAVVYFMTSVMIVLVGTVILHFALRQLMGARTDAEAEANRAWFEMKAREVAEGRLRQAHKMEAVGQLAGGIAHDFNNRLTVIRGNLELMRLAPGTDAASDGMLAAVDAVDRGRDLTRRLLAFSRKQPLQPVVTSVSGHVHSLRELLGRTLGEDVEVKVDTPPATWRAEVDRSELEGALLNLVLNARDAMTEGGRVTIRTRNMDVSESWAHGADVPPGNYVVIEVKDTGAGMSPEIVRQAFDPFFTTKEKGRGTGLGLSMVYGFIKQSGGHVEIDSKEGRGTTVRMFLPRTDQLAREEAEVMPAARPARGEVILVVEDDDQVRRVSVRMLEALGYVPLEAPDAAAALATLEAREVDLLFTDVILPGGQNGRDVARVARERRPNLPVLYTSGYPHDALVREGRLPPDVVLLAKPYSPEELEQTLGALLGARDQAAAAS